MVKRQSSMLSFMTASAHAKKRKDEIVTCGSPGNNSDTTHYPGSSDDGDDSSSRTRGVSVESSLSDSGSELQRVPLDIAKDKSEAPVQPHITFPARVYRERGSRSFQQSWYSVFPWMEYSIERDAGFCFSCRFFSPGTYSTLISSGFRDWKHATGKSGTLTYHDSKCTTHKESMLAWRQYKLTIAKDASIGVQIDRQGKRAIQENRNYVKCLLESLLFCAQQGIALRGHRETDLEDPSLNVGNFRSLMILHSRHNEIVKQRLDGGPRNASWLGHDMQNELISTMANWVLSKIVAEVKEARYFTLIADETKDSGKSEQLSIVLRYVYKGAVHERFIGYTQAHELNAAALTEYILEVLDKLYIRISDCISQCYDGASVMSGCCNGVSAKILDMNPKAVYIHCCAHRLNLVLVDSSKNIAAASDFFSLLESLYVFLSSSIPHSLFVKKQSELGQQRTIQLKKLSDTRWSCRYASIKAVKSTFSAVLATLEEIAEGSGSDRVVEARGLLFQVNSFQFLLSLLLFERIFSITAKLSDLLQAEHLNYAAAAACIKATKETIQSLRSETEWVSIWEQAVALASKHNIAVVAPRQRTRRLPERFSGTVVTSETTGNRSIPMDEYRIHVFYATLDVVVAEMSQRFGDLNLSLLGALQALLPSSEKFLDVDTLSPFLQHYEIDADEVQVEVLTAKGVLQGSANKLEFLHHVYNELLPVHECFPKLIQALKIAMTMGISSASAERSFSSLRRIKTYLRTTMSQERLSNLALLYVERDISTQLWDCLDYIIAEFAQKHKNGRIVLF